MVDIKQTKLDLNNLKAGGFIKERGKIRRRVCSSVHGSRDNRAAGHYILELEKAEE